MVLQKNEQRGFRILFINRSNIDISIKCCNRHFSDIIRHITSLVLHIHTLDFFQAFYKSLVQLQCLHYYHKLVPIGFRGTLLRCHHMTYYHLLAERVTLVLVLHQMYKNTIIMKFLLFVVYQFSWISWIFSTYEIGNSTKNAVFPHKI